MYSFFNIGASWGGSLKPRPGRFAPGTHTGSRAGGAGVDGCGKSWPTGGYHSRTKSLYQLRSVGPQLNNVYVFWCNFDRASSLICGNKMPTRCNRGFYCRSYCLLNMFRAPLCPSSGVQEYYTVVAAYGISCCGFKVAGLVIMLQHPANRTHNPQLHTRPATWKPQHEIPQAATTI